MPDTIPEASNLLLVSKTRSFGAIATNLSALFLGGLDVQFIEVGSSRALLRKHIVQALQAQHPEREPTEILRSLGADTIRPVTDAEALGLVNLREKTELDRLPAPTVAPDGIAWHLQSIKAPQAWGLLGGPGNIGWGDTVVGHIDTGYTRHPALGFRQSSGSWIKTALCRNFRILQTAEFGTIGQDEPQDGTDPLFGGPNDGHGTRIGTTISGFAPGDDGGADFFGAAPKVPHVVVRISDSVLIGSRNQQLGLADALNYLVDQVRVGTINLSMGIFPQILIREVRKAVNHAYDEGVILICAAGNYIDPVVSPARDTRTIAVGGVTAEDLFWSGSSFGPTIDWSAPAAGIRKATVDRRGRFGYTDDGVGTSYATALTTGTAALWLAHRGAEIQAAYPQAWQRVAAFRKLGRGTTRKPDPPKPWFPGRFGTGILDAAALLAAPLPNITDADKEAEL